MSVIVFLIPQGDSTLVAGTYTPSLNGRPMTVYIGSCDGYSVYPSFFAKENEQGYLTDLWFPYQGTITVDEEGVIIVDVLNTYDRAIKVTMHPGSEEAVENVETVSNLNKRMENGLFIIEKNGVQYNAIGNVIK
jgi:hypothetical protein